MSFTIQPNLPKIKARVGCRETGIGLNSCQTSPTLALVLGIYMKFRKRILSGEFFQNKKLAKLEPHARLLFCGLWLLADRNGLLIDSPIVLHGQIFPYETKLNIDKLLTRLCDSGFIIRYSINDDDYVWIPTFSKHQNVHPNETQSVIPLPENVIAGQCNGNGGAMKNRPLVKVTVKEEVTVKVKEEVRLRGNETDIIPYEEIIADLNQVAGTNFQATADSHRILIKARWNDPHTLDDFRHVHRVKAFEWLNDDKMATNLRPSTLYRKSHFDDYLGQRLSADTRFSDRDKRSRLAGDAWVKKMQAKALEVIDEN